MVFAHLFGVPVIVLPSLTSKVADSYLSWYSSIKQIVLTNRTTTVE